MDDGFWSRLHKSKNEGEMKLNLDILKNTNPVFSDRKAWIERIRAVEDPSMYGEVFKDDERECALLQAAVHANIIDALKEATEIDMDVFALALMKQKGIVRQDALATIEVLVSAFDLGDQVIVKEQEEKKQPSIVKILGMGALVIVAIVLVFMNLSSGSLHSEREVKCTAFEDSMGATVDSTIQLEADGDAIKKMYKKMVVTTSNKYTYEAVVDALIDDGYLEEYEEIEKGLTYSIDTDDENYKITEIVEVDLTEISLEDLRILTGDSTITADLSLEGTVENYKKDGYSCE